MTLKSLRSYCEVTTKKLSLEEEEEENEKKSGGA